MIPRLRQSFAKLSPEDIRILWREYLHHRGLPATDPPPVSGGLELFDELQRGGVMHCDLAAPLLKNPDYRRLLSIITGQEL